MSKPHFFFPLYASVSPEMVFRTGENLAACVTAGGASDGHGQGETTDIRRETPALILGLRGQAERGTILVCPIHALQVEQKTQTE